MEKRKSRCVICGKEYSGFGNNAEPLAKGFCCDICNTLVVLKRLERSEIKRIKMKEQKNENTNN